MVIRNINSPRQHPPFFQFNIYYQGKGFVFNEQFTSSLKLLAREGKYNGLAYLLADENGTSIKIAKYVGTDTYELIENDEYEYCLLIKYKYICKANLF